MANIRRPDPMQLVDELSMIYTACLMCYATFSFSRSRVFRQLLGIGLASLAIFITVSYSPPHGQLDTDDHPKALLSLSSRYGISSFQQKGRNEILNSLFFKPDPVFHQNAFALITAIVLLRSMYIMEVNIRPSFRAKYATVPQRYVAPGSITKTQITANAERDKKIIRVMWIMVAWGLSIFLGGFAIWGLDRVFCSTIRRWRHEVGLPWGILLEGHGWWLVNTPVPVSQWLTGSRHVMTGIGSYFYIVWAIWLRLCLNDKQDEYMLNWPSLWFSLPEVIPIASVEKKTGRKQGNGNFNGSNGHVKAN
jgi:dihydroceramidase